MKHPIIERDMVALRSKWEQAHYQVHKSGAHLIVVPGFLLPKGYNCTIATVLFVAPAGFPAARPDHFFTHTAPVELALDPPGEEFAWDSDGNYTRRYWHPKYTNAHNQPHPFDNWGGEGFLWWSWHLQMWNPNTDTLMTYMNAVRSRIFPAR